MDADRDTATLRQALAIFRELMELADCERVAWFEARCGDDAELRARVERLLAADLESDGPLDHREAMIAAAAGDFSAAGNHEHTEVVPGPRADNEARLGQHIGAYRLVNLLGHGGMGAVYLAERDEGGFRQQVALKLIRSGYEGSDARRRFERERQILSRLQHPSIARLYDGGVSDDGAPWFAMELIEGQTLTQWCTRWALPVRERVALVLRIAEAVQYAHQQLVIHRDLKPSNILIDAGGAPHVLDFGIAALLDEEEGDESTPRTFIHTPEYAAPEQIRGDPHSAATDVFTLGIILYEILAGTRPFQKPNASNFATQRAVLERATPRLVEALPEDSEAVQAMAAQRSASSGQVRRQLTGDIDRIVRKALEKRPQDRYPSVAALMDDLERYLEGRAVLAMPPAFTYRAGKFLWRHRVPVAALVAIFVILTVSTGVALQQANGARQQAERAEAVKQFMVSLFQQTRPEDTASTDISAGSLLDAGSARVADELGDQPRTAGELFNAIGNAYLYLGDFALARRQLEAALARLPASGDTLRPRFDVLVDLVDMASHQGDVTDGAKWVAEALAVRDELRRAQRGWRGWLSRSPTLHTYFGDAAQALDSRAEDLDLARARLLDYANRSDEALDLRRAVADARTARKGENETRLRVALNDYALALYAAGQYEEAARRLRALVANSERRHGPGHGSILRARHNLALALRRLDRLDEAERIGRENVEIAARVLPASHPLNAYIANALAGILRGQQRFREAAEWYVRARAVFDGKPDADPDMLATVHFNEAVNALMLGERERTAASLRAAERIWRDTLGPDFPRRADVELLGAQLSMERGEIDLAARTLDRLLQPADEGNAAEERLLLRATVLRAQVHLLAAEPAAARRLLETSWNRARALYPSPHSDQIEFLRLRAEAALASGDVSAASGLLDAAFAQQRERSADETVPELDLLRARVAWSVNDIDSAVRFSERARDTFEQRLGAGSPSTLLAGAWNAAAHSRAQPGPATRAALRESIEQLSAQRAFDPQTAELKSLVTTPNPP